MGRTRGKQFINANVRVIDIVNISNGIRYRVKIALFGDIDTAECE